MNRKLKEQHLSEIEIYCNVINSFSKVWVVFKQGYVRLIKSNAKGLQCSKRLVFWIKSVSGLKKSSADLHEEDLVPLSRGEQLLDLLQVHGQRFLTENVLLSVHEEHAHRQMMRVDVPHVHHV